MLLSELVKSVKVTSDIFLLCGLLFELVKSVTVTSDIWFTLVVFGI